MVASRCEMLGWEGLPLSAGSKPLAEMLNALFECWLRLKALLVQRPLLVRRLPGRAFLEKFNIGSLHEQCKDLLEARESNSLDAKCVPCKIHGLLPMTM